MVKVLVVAQIPPPYLGQPIMIEHVVRADMPGVEILHLPMVLSTNGSDVGAFRWFKVLRMVPTVLQIIRARFAHRPEIMYFPPAGHSRLTMYRDFFILGLTRFLFPKTVFHYHAAGLSDLYDELSAWQRFIFRKIYFHADAAIRTSECNPEDGKRLEARREYIVPNGIVDPCPNGPPRRAAAPVSEENPLRIVFVAILRESKGLLVLIEACGQLAARGVPFCLDVMGQFESEEFEARTRARVAELNLNDKVCFLGMMGGAEKFAVFTRSDVFSMPTFYEDESFPLVFIEAMACGLPVVATNWRGIPSAVDDDETGFLVEIHDPTAVADRLARLAGDASLRQEMGRAGRAKFVREYTLSRFIENMRQVFLDVGEEAPRAKEIPVAEKVSC